MENNNDPISAYIEAHTSSQSDLLYALYRETHLKVVHPRMISGPLQGKLLEIVSKMHRPKYILEVGTFTGYSAICLAQGLAEGGKLITIDKNDELSSISNPYFVKAGLEDKIELYNGDALEIIPGLDFIFDLVFLDGDKKQYLDYYNLVIDKLSTGGIILADNVLWDGKVVQEVDEADVETKTIIAFNTHIQNDNRVENIILPIRDGLSLIRKL